MGQLFRPKMFSQADKESHAIPTSWSRPCSAARVEKRMDSSHVVLPHTGSFGQQNCGGWRSGGVAQGDLGVDRRGGGHGDGAARQRIHPTDQTTAPLTRVAKTMKARPKAARAEQATSSTCFLAMPNTAPLPAAAPPPPPLPVAKGADGAPAVATASYEE